ncbi:MAG: metal ABC transporter permease [Verrucomicrobium sp.]|nr:metal ABC transporter permease [Verrucomicrobium sp.]
MDFWHYPFLRNAFLAALLLGPACGLLGVFVTLRGMAFFSDAIAHAALTGVALALLLQQCLGTHVDLLAVVLTFSLGLSAAMAHLLNRTHLRSDTVIAFSFTGSVALGVLLISKLGQYRLLDGVLFGDIYANAPRDLLAQAGLAAGLFAFFGWNLRPYLLTLVEPDLARVEGANLERLNLVFALLVGATVTLCLKMLGTLLLSGLIVIPPAAAKLVARNFRQMIFYSVGLGLVGAGSGVLLSYACDTPTGPTLVLTDLGLLFLCFIFRLK